jgi:hypothetical protein
LGSAENLPEVEIGDEEVLQLSIDASFPDDPETRKSTQGYLMKFVQWTDYVAVLKTEDCNHVNN